MAHKTWKRGTKSHRTPPQINHNKQLRVSAGKIGRPRNVSRSKNVFHPPGPVPKGKRHNAKEHRIFAIFRSKGYSTQHAWAATEGFSPHSIRQSGRFKTTSRTYSTTSRLAAAARRKR